MALTNYVTPHHQLLKKPDTTPPTKWTPTFVPPSFGKFGVENLNFLTQPPRMRKNSLNDEAPDTSKVIYALSTIKQRVNNIALTFPIRSECGSWSAVKDIPSIGYMTCFWSRSIAIAKTYIASICEINFLGVHVVLGMDALNKLIEEYQQSKPHDGKIVNYMPVSPTSVFDDNIELN